ncbi:hypothetical protein B0J12DRAFT_270664 [Macrophomina phaseolina]|uniref:Uncharacterized protein n=1 Tax=Macrophomina phaseolina TaxID=35725 RepID=A0ABQ8G0Z3_9PEZI|nr:hypothetical protein B0J12DRAFT_270664 [Macrophomina phaseolina]
MRRICREEGNIDALGRDGKKEDRGARASKIYNWRTAHLFSLATNGTVYGAKDVESTTNTRENRRGAVPATASLHGVREMWSTRGGGQKRLSSGRIKSSGCGDAAGEVNGDWMGFVWQCRIGNGRGVSASKRLIAVSQASWDTAKLWLSVSRGSNEAMPRAAWLALLRCSCVFARFTHTRSPSDSPCCARRQPCRNRLQVSVLSYPQVRQKWYDS